MNYIGSLFTFYAIRFILPIPCTGDGKLNLIAYISLIFLYKTCTLSPSRFGGGLVVESSGAVLLFFIFVLFAHPDKNGRGGRGIREQTMNSLATLPIAVRRNETKIQSGFRGYFLTCENGGRHTTAPKIFA